MTLIKTSTTQSIFTGLILVLILFALPTVTRASLGGGNALNGALGASASEAASHDLHLIGQTEHHRQTHKGSNAGGKIGISIGSTTGFFLSLHAGGAQAHGNGTTHQITALNAQGTLNLDIGHNVLLNGAQAKGHRILADIGHDLTLKSQQDTGDFKSHSWQAGLTIVYNGGVEVSAHAAFSGMNNHYKSVKHITGLAAGLGGYHIHVGHHTDLTGAVIASTADPSKNSLNTGRLSYSALNNIAQYKSYSISVGGGTAGGGSFTGGIGLPQHHHAQSTTQAGIAQGTLIVRHGHADLTGLSRHPDINAHGLKRKFNRNQLHHHQQLAKVTGYVTMRSVGALAEYQQNQAANAYNNTQKKGDTVAQQAALTKLNRWSDGGINTILLHGAAGALTASLGGGNALNGALGASASEAASGQLQRALINHGLSPNKGPGKGLMQLASIGIGGLVGGGQGATTALQGEKYNRQLHQNEIQWIKNHAQQFAQQQCGCDPTDQQIQHATATLAQQAARDVDLLWTLYSPPGKNTQSAQAFLNGATGTFTNETGQQQKLFTTEGNQYLLPSLGANGASLRFYKKNIQPGATRSVSTYLKAKGEQQLQHTSANLKQEWAYTTHHPGDAFVNTIKGDWNVLNGALTSLREGAWQLVRHPVNSGKRIGHGVAHSFKEGGTTWGVTAATWNGVGRARLNAVYGQDITAAQRTLQGLQSTAVLGLAVLGGEGLGEVADAGVTGVAEGVGSAAGKLVDSSRAVRAWEAETVGTKIGIEANQDMRAFLPVGEGGRRALPNGLAVDMEAGGASQYDQFRLPNGKWDYPESGGAVNGTQETFSLNVGTIIDRLGDTDGAYLAPDGSSLTGRALSPGSAAEYHRYRVLKPIEFEKSEVQPAFGEKGHEIQYKIPRLNGERRTVQNLLEDGYLEELK